MGKKSDQKLWIHIVYLLFPGPDLSGIAPWYQPQPCVCANHQRPCDKLTNPKSFSASDGIDRALLW